jgi:hypothetical protein
VIASVSAPDSRQGVINGWTRRTHGRQADVVHNRVRIWCRQVANIDAGGCGRTHRHLHRSISGNDVPANEIALHAGNQKDPVGIARDDVVDDDVVVGPWNNEADAEIAPLSRITISTQPVRTEPVTACAGGQSYAAARGAGVAVPHGNVPLEFVLVRGGHEDAGEAVRRYRDQRHENTRTSADDLDAVRTKLLDDARALNDIAPSAIDQDAALPVGLAAAAPRGGIR